MILSARRCAGCVGGLESGLVAPVLAGSVALCPTQSIKESMLSSSSTKNTELSEIPSRHA